MRRFVAVFTSKREKHSNSDSKHSHHTDQAQSSASSSSGSASLYLQTPEDENHHIVIVDQQRQPSNKSWKSWVKHTTRSKQSQKHLPPPLPESLFSSVLSDVHSDPSEDVDQIHFIHDPPNHPTVPPQQKLITLVNNSLAPPPILLSPFIHQTDIPFIFPRSVNPSKILTRRHTLASTLLKTRLQARLKNNNSLTLTPAEELSIASLASRQIPAVAPATTSYSPFDELAPSNTAVVSLSSSGLKRWISRPCFEDRCAAFTPDNDGTILYQRVTGTALAVAALEYSEALEAMVDFDIGDTIPLPSPFTFEVQSPAPETLSKQPTSPSQSHIPMPSPLRNEHDSNSIHIISQSAPPEPPVVAPEPIVKRGVRFAKEDKNHVIPADYSLRIKRQREEKAIFLRAERERRTLETEKLKREEEQRKRDAERAEWDNERRAWEREKKAMEEEKQRMYSEQVIAARLRRESQRAGGVPALMASNNNLNGLESPGGPFPASASSVTSERNKLSTARRQSRPVYDSTPPFPLPRREPSHPTLPIIGQTGPLSIPIARSTQYDSSISPESSRPPSIKGTPPTAGSTPPLPSTSVYSSHDTSSEDVRAAVAAAAKRNKRSSIAASMAHNNSSGSLGGHASSYPVWNNDIQNPSRMVPLPIMMVPPGFVMMDTPLLPPTPPFMLQQYLRQRGSPGSGSGASSSRGRMSNSRNSSREQVNVGKGDGGGGRAHPPRSASFPDRMDYKHLSSPVSGSGNYKNTESSSTPWESRRASMPTSSRQQHRHPQQYEQRPSLASHNDHHPPHSRSQPAMMSRGGSMQHLHPQNPWTGLPTQNGKLPSGMPASRQQSYSNTRTPGSSTKNLL